MPIEHGYFLSEVLQDPDETSKTARVTTLDGSQERTVEEIIGALSH